MENIIVAEWLNAEKYIAGLAGQAYSPADAADIVSAAKVQCLNKFDDSKGASVKSFMVLCYQQARQVFAIASKGLHVPTSSGVAMMAQGRDAELEACNCTSLNAERDGDGDEGDANACTLQDSVSIEQFTPAQVACINDDNSRLFNARQTLSATENRILSLRFEECLTLQETGKLVGLSYERVRQIENKATAKLRAKLRD